VHTHLPDLTTSRVLLVGLEPWGAAAAMDLAAAGLGAVHLLDDAFVTEDDLDPATPFVAADRGRPRAAALSEAIARAAPWCAVSSGPLRAAPERALMLDDARWDLVLACAPGDDLLVLSSVARFAHDAGAVSLYACLDGLEAVIGPAVVPGETACWNCCRLRRLANSPTVEADRSLHAALLAARPGRRARTYLAPTAGVLGHAIAPAAIALLADPRSSPLAGRIAVRSLTRLTTSTHAVLRLPWCDVCGGARGAAEPPGGPGLDAARDVDELRRMLAGVVDERTGIVRTLELDASAPAMGPEAPRTATATLAAQAAHRCPVHGGEPVIGAGKGLTPLEAMVSAVGEAVERYAAGWYDRRALRRASLAEMRDDHLAPDRICLYDDAQYALPGFPYTRIGAHARIDWVLGRWLDTGSPVYVPALPAYFDYPVPREEAFCQVTSNGLAAAATREGAAMGAALELIERDAFMMTWLARLPGRRVLIDDSLDAGTREVVRQIEERGARVALWLVSAGVDVPVVVCAAFGDGRRWPGATVAMAAHLSPRRAIRKAILEQGHVGTYLRRHLIEKKVPVPERPEDVRTLDDHAFYYFPPSRAAAFAFLDGGGATRAGDLEEPAVPSLAALVGRLARAGRRVAIVDVTSPDLAPTPLRVARALGPDFLQIHFGHRLGQLGNRRLVATAPLGTNPDPHPMA
jgi:ribosomal protein S12 methylthiotransferase accessory factor